MKNLILKALSSKEYRIISAHLKPVMLVKGSVLYEVAERITDVYFPEDAIISYLSGTAEGESLEVSVIGNEAVVGIASLLGESTAFRAVVQIPGRAYSMKREVLRREFKRYEGLHRVLLHYTNALIVQVAQTAVCNKLGRWCNAARPDRKSTRLNSSHSQISYAVFCLKKKKK